MANNSINRSVNIRQATYTFSWAKLTSTNWSSEMKPKSITARRSWSIRASAVSMRGTIFHLRRQLATTAARCGVRKIRFANESHPQLKTRIRSTFKKGWLKRGKVVAALLWTSSQLMLLNRWVPKTTARRVILRVVRTWRSIQISSSSSSNKWWCRARRKLRVRCTSARLRANDSARTTTALIRWVLRNECRPRLTLEGRS